MASYVVLLRGIAPMNPNMRNKKICELFERIGFSNTRAVIASGNILFDAKSGTAKTIETKIERAIEKHLKFKTIAIVRSRAQIAKLVKARPFGTRTHSKKTNLNMTFLKHAKRINVKFPYTGKGYVVLGDAGRVVRSVADITQAKTPDVMRWLEATYGKEVTTRTWSTVERIHEKFKV